MITGVFGKPRAGKTTYSVRVVQKNKKKLNFCNKYPFFFRILKPYSVIYCTDPTIQDTIHIDYSEVGLFKPLEHSLIILEECGLGFNNRKWKSLSSDAEHIFAMHGHIGVDILWSSQTVDVDKKLLDRTHKLYLIERGLDYNRSVVRLIRFQPDVDDQTHDLKNMYLKRKGFLYFLEKLLHKSYSFDRRKYYKYFDSYHDNWNYSLPDPATGTFYE